MNLNDQIINTLQQWQEQIQSGLERKSFATLEEASLVLGYRIAQLVLSHLLEEAGTGYDRSIRPCPCQGKQRFERMAAKTVRTLMGEVTYKRAYYRCRECGESSFPLDEQLGQSQREISPLVQRAVALIAARLSFSESEKVLNEITQVKLTSRQIETVAEEVGAEAERRQMEEDKQASSLGLVSTTGPNPKPARTFIVEMDGVQVGLQEGGWQEVKCGIVYELSQRAEVNQGRWELLNSQRCALRGDVKEFRQRLWGVCVREGIREQDRIVVIGDGAEWIDQTAQLLFPGALRILDYYHVSERVWAVANARWGEGSDEARRWAEEKLRRLKEGGVEEVIASIKRLKMKGEGGEEVRRGAVRYMSSRVEQMRYGEYGEKGLPRGSGAVESSCKQMVTARCKQAGMRWSEAGVDAILALRCLVLNGRLDELCPKPVISLEWKEAA